MKIRAILTMFILMLALTVSGCSPSTDIHSEGDAMATEETVTSENMEVSTTEEETPNEESMDESTEMSKDDILPEMTLDELSKFNGDGGQPIYVAVDGIVYDVSHLEKWMTGKHMGQHDAGQDLSDAILKSPHGKKILERAIPVAELVE